MIGRRLGIDEVKKLFHRCCSGAAGREKVPQLGTHSSLVQLVREDICMLFSAMSPIHHLRDSPRFLNVVSNMSSPKSTVPMTDLGWSIVQRPLGKITAR